MQPDSNPSSDEKAKEEFMEKLGETIIDIYEKIADIRKEIEIINTQSTDKITSEVATRLLNNPIFRDAQIAIDRFNKNLNDFINRHQHRSPLLNDMATQVPTFNNPNKSDPHSQAQILTINFSTSAKKFKQYSFEKEGRTVKHAIEIDTDDLLGPQDFRSNLQNIFTMISLYGYDEMNFKIDHENIFFNFKNIKSKIPDKK